MESLAIFVAIILGIAVFSGPIALFLTWLPVINREETKDGIAIIRRIFVTLLTVTGSLVSFMLFTAAAGTGGNLVAIFGSVTAFFAAKREYFPDGLRNGKPKENSFGRRGDRRNGPDGQH
jgi:hypothetical protein